MNALPSDVDEDEDFIAFDDADEDSDDIPDDELAPADPCERCNGTGQDWTEDDNRCRGCNGTGEDY